MNTVALSALVVDDEEVLAEAIAAELEFFGFKATQVFSANDALKLLRSERFDIVISDIRMPGMTGLELFQKTRSLGLETPFVLMTGFSDHDHQDSPEMKATSMIYKPFDPDVLISTCRRLVQQNGGK